MKQELDGLVSNYVKETVSSQVNGAVIKALRGIDFQKLVEQAVRDHLSQSLEKYEFPKNSIKADAINFEGYKQIHKDFTSTGIDDRSTAIQLSILDGNVVVENNLVTQTITTQKNIDVGQRIRSKSLSVAEGSILHDLILLGKAEVSGTTDFKGTVKLSGDTYLQNIAEANFKDGSIPHGAINWAGFELPQESVQQGKIEKFSSTGITDYSTQTQIAITNELVSISTDLGARKVNASSMSVDGKVTSDSIQIENGSVLKGQTEIHDNVIASKNIDVHGKVTVLDGLEVRGNMSVPDTLKDHLVEYMNSKIKLESIVPEGGSIQIGKRTVLDENTLGGTVISSNLRKVGTLRELVVAGESKLADKIYFSPLGRIGVNTDEPTAPLDIWDEEVQVTVGKNKSRTGWLGTTREHNLEIGVNRDAKVTITPSQTKIKNPVLNSRTYTDGPSVPGHSGQVGDIHWNTFPKLGDPIGWVCLENNRWASFGEIEDK